MSNCPGGVQLDRLFPGEGQMARLYRATDWSTLPPGDVGLWPHNLRASVSLMMESRCPIIIAWGPEFRCFYNDAFLPVLGHKHPVGVAKPGAEVFPEAWHRVEPLFQATREGKAVGLDDVYIPLERNGRLEDCFFTLSLSPIREESGVIGGSFAVIVDTTLRVEDRRRLSTLRDLSHHTSGMHTPEQACRAAAVVLDQNPVDVPFSLLYLTDRGAREAKLAATSGVKPDGPLSPSVIRLDVPDEEGWPLWGVVRLRETVTVEDLHSRFEPINCGAYGEPPVSAMVLPLVRSGMEQSFGVFIAGVNPRRGSHTVYHEFFHLVADRIAGAIAHAHAYQEERFRAEELKSLIQGRTADLYRSRSAALNLMEDALAARRQADLSSDALRRSEQHLELISNSLPALISYVGRDLCYRTCNHTYLNWFGLSLQEIVGRTMREVLGDAAWNVMRPRVEAAFAGETVEFETEAPYRHGGSRWIHAVYTPHRNASNEVVGIIIMVMDISARKRAEEALAESEERFRAIVNQATVGVTQADFSGRFIFVNPRYCEIVGYTEGELLNMRMQDITHPQDLPGNLEQFSKLSGEGSDFVIEKRYIRKDGAIVWVNDSVSGLRDAQGRLQGALAVTLDISERMQQEAELTRRSRQQSLMYELADRVNRTEALSELYQKTLDVIISALNADRSAILLFDDDGVMRFKAWRGLSDEYRSRVEGHSPWTAAECDPKPIIIADIDKADLEPSVRATVRLEGIRALSFIPLSYGGRLLGKFMVYFNRPHTMDEEEVSLAQAIAGTLAIGIERRTAEIRLLESKAQLQTLADQLEQLVDERTQELVQSRDQLRALATELNLTEQRERKRMAGELHDYLAQLLVLAKMKLGQGKRLVEHNPACSNFIRESQDALTEALTYTRTLVADLSPPVLHDFGLPTALRWLGQQMERHQLKVTVQVSPDFHPKLPNDQALLLFQSVRELLMNASKHSGTDEAALSLIRQNDRLRIEVRDRGRGFSVGGSSLPSTKFGLVSIRERMRALGGTFEIESSPDAGTMASLILPIAGEQPETTREDVSGVRAGDHFPAVQAGAKSIRVLLVDDHAMVRQGLRSVLESYADIEVVGEASDGEEAVAMCERLRPSLVVMDINMPKLNGAEATARIKARFPDTVVIGLSVQAGHESHLAMLRAGATRLLTKEAAVDQLYQAMLHALNKTVESPT